MTSRLLPPALLITCVAAAPTAFAQSTATEETTQSSPPRVEVIGTTPLPGLGVPIEQIPNNVQVLRPRQIEDRQSINLPDLMSRTLPSVNVNEVTGNPFQADVNYRGFVLSPLLGTPQGLSVFQDGVRLNEPFGDVVYWDLIPQQAISSIELIPGSNPLFGLNTLGGALSLRTKNGRDFPNSSVQIQGGSWGRWAVDFEHGGHSDYVDYYFAGSWFDENGWRERSPSTVRQLFGKIGFQDSTTDLHLSLGLGDTDLVGNGVTPESMLERRRKQVYTVPDVTNKNMWMLNLTGTHLLTNTLQLGGNVYYRSNRIRTLNGDANDEYGECYEDAVANLLDPLVECPDSGSNNRSRSQEHAYGAGLQLSHLLDRNRLTLGVSFDRGTTDFTQVATGGLINAARGVDETEDPETENSLTGATTTYSIFLTDTFNLTPNTALTLSGRYNHTNVKTNDRLNSTPPNLDADYTYESFNPGIGLTHTFTPALSLFGGWNQGTRAPTPIELGCADPANPCTLPNSMQADPFLKQVRARTFEGGLRGKLLDNIQWSASAFRADNSNDILFVSTGTSAGYFTNFGKTRRQGAEFGLNGTAGKFSWMANYAYVKATFRSGACILSENNSSRGQSAACAADDEIRVSPGDRLPGIPEHQLKLALDFRPLERVTLGLDMSLFSKQYARGNENNQHRAGTFTDQFGTTREFEGSGEVDAYAVFNFTARYRFAKNWEVFARIDNLFDTHYETAAILAQNVFDANNQFQSNPDDWTRETFFAPGAPRAVWVGVKFSIDRTPQR